MESSLSIVFVATTLAALASSSFGKTRAQNAPDQTISIRVYDRAEIPAGTLRSALDEASRLFRTAGIRINWEQPAVASPEDRGIDMSSAASPKSEQRSYVVVRVLRPTPERILPDALGFSLPFASSGAHVSIFYDRVDGIARSMNTVSYVVLGYAVAHEVGHVLLRSSEHTTGGLMQGRWNRASWRLASAGLLAFRREDAERMGEGLRRFQDPNALPEHESMLASSVQQRSSH
jgi:hypothetical protein